MRKVESGIWIRVGREKILLEDMHPTDRKDWLLNLRPDGLLKTIEILCWTIRRINK